MSILLNTIINSIKNKNCVLVLGPDLYVKEINGSLVERKQYFSELENEVKSCIYFSDEDIFDFHQDDRRTIKNKIQEFYIDGGDYNLFELISTVRFPLIINVSPDSTLKDFCDANGVILNFDVFKGDHDEKKEIVFSSENPILYNIFGNSNSLQDIIADHKQLFRHVQKLLPEDSFPESIREFLEKVSCFIFLGFKFNSWIFQLISYKILSHKNPDLLEEDRVRLSYSDLNKFKLEEIKTNKANNSIKSTNVNKENLVNIVMTSSVGMEFTDSTPSQLMSEIISGLNTKRLDSFIRNVKNQEKYSSYLSYAHAASNAALPNISTIADALLDSFKKNNSDGAHLKIVYDKDALSYGQSIDSFMTRIGKGKTALLIVSDKYLKSEYCMTEAKRIFKYNNNDERIFAIIIKDTLQQNDEYEIFWKDKALELVENKKNKIEAITNAIDFSNEMPYIFEKLNNIKYLEINLSDFELQENGKPILKAGVQQNLDDFTLTLIEKLKE